MGASEKRRNPVKKRVSRAPTREAVSVTRQAWVNEALGVVCGVGGLFLLISILSFRFDGLLYEVSLSALRSPMGPAGRVLGTLLSGFFGWCAIVPALWLAWMSWYLWNCDDGEALFPKGIRTIVLLGMLGLMIFSCALASTVGDSSLGGRVGGVISSPLIRVFGVPGAALLLFALLLSSIALTTGQSVGNVVVSSIATTVKVVKALALTLSVGSAKGIGIGTRAIGLLISSVAKGRGGNERSIPTPRARKNHIALERDEDEECPLNTHSTNDGESDDESEEESEPDEAPVSHEPAVVQRKTGEGRLPDREIRKVRKRVVEQIVEGEGVIQYVPPDLTLLARGESTPGSEDDEELREKSRQIEGKLRDFGIMGKVTQIHPGPVITLFEFEPAPGVKVGKIASLSDDLAMSLRASSIRIIAPIPKRGTVGIEVPNRHRDVVRLRDILECEEFLKAESLLTVPIGKDTYGEPVVADIATMPHLLIAGTTGTGKSVCINALLVSLLYRASPADLGLILIDPKILELSTYEGIPHLKVPVVTVPRQAKAVLEWAVNEMNRRYRVMQKFGVRNIDSYNRVVAGEDEDATVAASKRKEAGNIVHLKEEEIIEPGIVEKQESTPGDLTGEMDSQITEKLKPLPKIVIVIDELADLMLTVGRDIEELITRLAQKARAAGIHLIVATQRPSVDVVTGLIKANFPARVSFRVATRVDSRTILDSMGADKLLGRGDMLLMFPGGDGLRRVHGAFVSDSEVKKVVDSVKAQSGPRYDERIMALCEKALEDEQSGNPEGSPGPDEYDDMYDKCVQFVVERGQASTSMLQRAFRLGYNRAARIVDMMEREGIVGPMDGAKPREVLVPTDKQQQQEGNG